MYEIPLNVTSVYLAIETSGQNLPRGHIQTTHQGHSGGTGVFPSQWILLQCQERPSWVLKIVENL